MERPGPAPQPGHRLHGEPRLPRGTLPGAVRLAPRGASIRVWVFVLRIASPKNPASVTLGRRPKACTGEKAPGRLPGPTISIARFLRHGKRPMLL